MASTIVQLNFSLTVAPEDYEAAVTPMAQAFADVPGLQWKIWLMNEAASEAGGIYLFRDEASADAFLTGPLAAQVAAAPILTNLSAKQFSSMEALTSVTRGPVQEALEAH